MTNAPLPILDFTKVALGGQFWIVRCHAPYPSVLLPCTVWGLAISAVLVASADGANAIAF